MTNRRKIQIALILNALFVGYLLYRVLTLRNEFDVLILILSIGASAYGLLWLFAADMNDTDDETQEIRVNFTLPRWLWPWF